MFLKKSGDPKGMPDFFYAACLNWYKGAVSGGKILLYMSVRTYTCVEIGHCYEFVRTE